ncbi:MAG TPA: prepilin-type N-terminal cleavage/methylation domain-containing protein [Porticoccus sp.]|nr:prepilin-type N-terminal cleavage/methylation domain-containing protein [Porticoccus sp.]
MLIRINRKQAGFSLLEVIVALAVLGICVSVILRIFSGVVGATRIVDDYAQAVDIAETQMAMLVAQDNPLGTDTGMVGDYYRWNTQVTEFKLDSSSPLLGAGGFTDLEAIYLPYHYQVVVKWGDNKKRQLEISTIRLGVRP